MFLSPSIVKGDGCDKLMLVDLMLKLYEGKERFKPIRPAEQNNLDTGL